MNDRSDEIYWVQKFGDDLFSIWKNFWWINVLTSFAAQRAQTELHIFLFYLLYMYYIYLTEKIFA